MSKPILSTVDGECREIVGKAGCGVFVEPENDAGMADAILALKNNNGGLAVMGSNGSNYVERHFDRESLALGYLDIFKEMDLERIKDKLTDRFVGRNIRAKITS